MTNDILNNVIVPIEEPNSILTIIRHCLQDEGQNKKHSRSLKLSGYRPPVNANLSKDEQEILSINSCYIILRCFAERYLTDLKKINADLSLPVSLYFEEISNKEITGKDLEYICTHNYNELCEYNKANIKLPLSKLLWTFLINTSGLDSEHFSSDSLYKDKSMQEGETLFWGYSKRIYMNLPRNSQITYEFGLQYVMKCINRKIPFNMKLFGAFIHGDNDLDGTIFYTKNKYFNDHIAILNEILEEHPEYKMYLGTPIYTAGHIVDSDGSCYMAISHGGNSYYSTMLHKPRTYNDTADDIINFTYTLSCCKLIKYFFAYFTNKIDRNLYRSITNLLNSPLNFNTLIELDKIQTEVRKVIYDFILYKKQQGDINYVLNLFNGFMVNSFPNISSLVNFGDLEHTNVPIYKDPNFLIYEQNQQHVR